MNNDFCLPEYESCTVCPKKCGVNRNAGNAGFCGETAALRIAWAGLHFGEEPPVTGHGGSGTIFITGCNLRCTFCQNFQISQKGMGRAVSKHDFAVLCLKLQAGGAENINIVTGSHAIPALNVGLRYAKQQGLSIPVVWNSSAYENTESLQMLNGTVDGWLPDIKTLNTQLAEKLFAAPDYPKVAQCAIRTMAALSPLFITYPDETHYPFGKMISGVIVRHLALPGKLEQTKAVLRWFAGHLKNTALLSLMTQYTPVAGQKPTNSRTCFSNRLLRTDEDTRLREYLTAYKIDDGFYQEPVNETDWLPDFNRVQTFSANLSKPFWHWKKGWIHE